MLPDNLKTISSSMIQRYSNRYDQYGYDIKTLGWGTVEQQHYRFLMTLTGDADFSEKSILDIGCGFGDYFRFLKGNDIPIAGYTGVDINPDLIGEAEKKAAGEENVRFSVLNLMAPSGHTEITADIGVMLGLLNVHLKDDFDNDTYSKKMIENAFAMTKELLIVDFISTKRTDTYPKEDFIFYHDPAVMLEFALTLSDHVALKHNYKPIPQREFMLFIHRDHG